MYIKDVEPNGSIGINLLDKINAEELIDRMIEEPLKKPCLSFYRKGIKTVMSSANKNNIVPSGEKPKKKEDVKGGWIFLDSPTFEDAGVGYAWIMLDFDNLSDENKEILLRLEERNDENGNNVGEDAIWFVHPTISPIIHRRESEDQNYIDFESKAIILGYNDRYPENTVILRMPVNGNTTADEVEEYFSKMAELLKAQRVKEVENNEKDKGREE